MSLLKSQSVILKEISYNLINKLSYSGVKVNVTAIMTIDQVKNVVENLNPDVSSYVSVFAGRVADTGIDQSLMSTV